MGLAEAGRLPACGRAGRVRAGQDDKRHPMGAVYLGLRPRAQPHRSHLRSSFGVAPVSAGCHLREVATTRTRMVLTGRAPRRVVLQARDTAAKLEAARPRPGWTLLRCVKCWLGLEESVQLAGDVADQAAFDLAVGLALGAASVGVGAGDRSVRSLVRTTVYRAWLSWRSPERLSRTRMVWPLEAGMGAAPPPAPGWPGGGRRPRRSAPGSDGPGSAGSRPWWRSRRPSEPGRATGRGPRRRHARSAELPGLGNPPTQALTSVTRRRCRRLEEPVAPTRRRHPCLLQDIAALTLARDLRDLRLAQR
jgi:hypothetical protein